MITTVAVASYNHAPYIRECLGSIVEQTHEEIELCWVDDHSSDGSFDELRRALDEPAVAGRFSSMSVRRNSQNRGAAFSLNLAARLGTGELLSFMNSDDFYHPSRLETLQRPYRGQEFFMAFSNVMPIGPAGNPLMSDSLGERIAFEANLLCDRLGLVSRALLARQIMSSTGNFLVTRALFERIGGFEDLKYCHDWMFALQACQFCEPFFERDRLYYYRLHPENSFRNLGSLADAETHYVLSRFFESIALRQPQNVFCPCPRREPAAFWELLRVTHTHEFAERVFFPYMRASRLLTTS